VWFAFIHEICDLRFLAVGDATTSLAGPGFLSLGTICAIIVASKVPQ